MLLLEAMSKACFCFGSEAVHAAVQEGGRKGEAPEFVAQEEEEEDDEDDSRESLSGWARLECRVT